MPVGTARARVLGPQLNAVGFGPLPLQGFEQVAGVVVRLRQPALGPGEGEEQEI